MLNLFDGESDTPELIWDNEMRGELRKVTGIELDLCMKFRRENGTGNESFNLESNVRVKYTKLENELFIGGVYVTRFLKEPTFNLRDPTSFLEMLLQRWTHELQMCTENESNGEEKHSTDVVLGGQDILQLVTDAIVYLCKIRTNLCDKLTQWGYMARCLSFLENILRRDLVGSPLLSVMRILHVAVNRRVNVESLIASGTNDRLHGIIAFTMRAVGDTTLHADAGFMLEMLKKIFVDALGDVQKASQLKSGFTTRTSYSSAGNNYAMAPSPAPGENPVSRNRVRVNMGDDPLGLGGGFPPAPAPVTRQGVMPSLNTSQNYGQAQQMGATNAYSGIGGQSNFNQMGSSQNYNVGPQQPQQAYNAQTVYGSSSVGNTGNHMYGGIQNQQQFQPMQPTQPSNLSQQYTVGQQQQQHQRPVVGSFSQRSAMAQQRTYTSQGNHHQLSNQQHTGPTVSSSINGLANPSRISSSGQGMHSSYNADSQNSSNFSQYNVNQTNPQLTGQSLGQNPLISQGSQSSHFHQTPKPTFQSNQAQAPARMIPAGNMGSYETQVPPSQTHGVNIQPTPSTISYQQPTNNQTTTNSTRLQSDQIPIQSQHQHVISTNQYSHQPPNPYPNQQHQSYQGSQQSLAQSTNAPVVETVTNDVQEINAVNPSNDSHLPPPPQHQNSAVNEGSGIDARTQPVPSIQAARNVETVHGAPDSADGRRALLESALLCDIPTYLIESVLENPNLPKVKDPASVKVHVVELLKLLTQDPGYGMKFQLILDKIPNWKKYVSQDHSLFITGIEQKTDYFLTDGSSSMDPKKLLKN